MIVTGRHLPRRTFLKGLGAAVALPIIWKFRTSPVFIARWAPACSAAVVLLGSFWFVERVWMN